MVGGGGTPGGMLLEGGSVDAGQGEKLCEPACKGFAPDRGVRRPEGEEQVLVVPVDGHLNSSSVKNEQVTVEY